MSRNPLADQVWRQMAELVVENRSDWRRAVVERADLPFSRIRILLRLGRAPMTVKEIGAAVTIDAPAATVAVNDLERRGFVVRRVNPANRRCKEVSLTEPGRAMVEEILAVDDPAPDGLATLGDDELLALRRALDRMVTDPLLPRPDNIPPTAN